MAGAGATTALVAAAAVSLLSLGALFSVNGFPGGLGGPAEADSVVVPPSTGAPEATAAALAVAPDAVAATPPGIAAAGATATGVPGAPGAPDAGSTTTGTAPVEGVSGAPGAPVAPGTPVAPAAPAPGTAPPATSPNSGPLSDTVSGLDNATQETTGLDLPLEETTGPLTDQLDQTVEDTLGGLGLGGNN
jgi:hypothetical protein